MKNIAYNKSIRLLSTLPNHNKASEMIVNLNIIKLGRVFVILFLQFRLAQHVFSIGI